jgi:hypothetical protein
MNWRPDILAAPNIPKPLHTVNPRSIMGRKWWDVTRQDAYAKNSYKCWACGTHKKNAEYHQWLEAHEDYDIDWKTGRVELKEIVALCHSCHNFIHNGRLYAIYRQGEVSRDKVMNILNHGFDICKRNNIQPYFGAYLTLELMEGPVFQDFAIQSAKKKGWYPTEEAPWEKWHLVIEGKKYYSPFKNLQEWENHWN